LYVFDGIDLNDLFAAFDGDVLKGLGLHMIGDHTLHIANIRTVSPFNATSRSLKATPCMCAGQVVPLTWLTTLFCSSETPRNGT
jgi:hypothetical protein